MTIYVVSSGTTSGITVGSGSVMSVLDTGVATDIIVNSGGVISAYDGGITSGTLLSGSPGVASEENVYSGGTSYNTSAHDAFLSVYGGKAYGTKLTHSSHFDVLSGGVAYKTSIGGKSSATTSNGTFSATRIGNGGELVLFDNGDDYNTVAVAGGEEVIEDGATAYNTNLVAGLEYLLDGTASGTQVQSGSNQMLYGDSKAVDTIVFNGGMEQVMSGTAIDTTISSGGTETLFGGTESGTEIAGGTLQLDGGKVTGDINFIGTGGELETSPAPSNQITGFTAGDTIFIVGIESYMASDSVSVTQAGIVTVAANGRDYNFHVKGAVIGETDFNIGPPPPGQYGILLAKSAPPGMTFLHPPANPSAGLAANFDAITTAASPGPEFALKIIGGREAVVSATSPSALHIQQDPTPPPNLLSAHGF